MLVGQNPERDVVSSMPEMKSDPDEGVYTEMRKPCCIYLGPRFPVLCGSSRAVGGQKLSHGMVDRLSFTVVGPFEG